MSIVWIDADRLDELTEWCRNKPEEAARRILCAEGAGAPRRGSDLLERMGPFFEPPVSGGRARVKLVGGPYNGEFILISDREGVVRLDGLVYTVESKRDTGMGLPRCAHYSGTTVA